MSRTRINPVEKIAAVQMYLDGKGSQRSIAVALNISKTCFQQWIRNYESMGTEAFSITDHKKYSALSKQKAVQAYLNGTGSQDDICKEYGIRSKSELQRWIMKYNRHEELKTSGTGGTIVMTKARKTNMDERIKIVSYCIANDKNYGETAEKFNVSYQQVYSWIKKYTARGIEGLEDRRGRSEPIVKPVTDIEKLKAELELEKAKNQRLQVENDFLKTLEEIERRRY